MQRETPTFATSDLAASSIPMFSLAEVSNQAWNLFSRQYSSNWFMLPRKPSLAKSHWGKAGSGSSRRARAQGSKFTRSLCWPAAQLGWPCRWVGTPSYPGLPSTSARSQRWRVESRQTLQMPPQPPCSRPAQREPHSLTTEPLLHRFMPL